LAVKAAQIMHGQKKRRKRTISGSFSVEEVRLHWELISEPQWTSEHGYKGMCFSVRTEDGKHRELILQYPMPQKLTGIGLPQLPQRPRFSARTIVADTLRAIAAGWEPMSRGKTFVFKLPKD
jgi:hypothetical protein